MTMFDVSRGYEEPPMLVVGIGSATEDCLAEEGLEMQAADLHLLEVAKVAGELTLTSATRSE